MGSITSGVGLVSGINTAQLIEQLIAFESRGKNSLTARVASLTTKRTALLDVNSRLLALKAASTSFRVQKVFQSALATSSADTTATAVASNSTPVGSYQFFVKQLATASQSRSKGYSTFDATPLGLDSISFELGDVGVRRSVDLSSLNGGEGVRRGKIQVTDKSGNDATIDLSKATTLEEVVATINATNDAEVSAAIDGERLIITDTSGGAGTLTIANGSGSFAATDLGIVGSTPGSTITSSQINKLGVNTTLASLNDGLGVLIRDGTNDFKIFVDDGVTPTTYNISLGRENLPITGATELASLNNGSGVKINTTDAPDLVVKTSTGAQVEIDLGVLLDSNGEVDEPAVTTVQEMLNRVNEQLADELGSGKVVMSINPAGDRFVLTDTMGGAETLRVIGGGPNGDTTAKNLGIFTGTTGTGAIITGSKIVNEAAKPRAATIQDVIDRIAEATGNAVTASINVAGTGLRLSSAFEFAVVAGDGDGSSQSTAIAERTARDLGIFDLTDSNTIGSRVLSGAGTILARNINGGAGLTSSTNALTLQDRSGASFTINNLNSYTTLENLIDAVNSAALSANVDITLGVGSDNASLLVSDTSGGTGNLIVGGSAASALGIENAGVAATTIRGGNLEIKYISEAQTKTSLNYGRGLGTGTFRLTDSTGSSASVDIGSDSVTLYDVMREINSRGLAIEARLNDTGDGLLLVDTAGTPTGKMKVEDTSGSVAKNLGILKTAATNGGDIDGSYERTVDLDTTDSMKKVIEKINAAGLPVSATSINIGSGATPFYLTLSSTVTGSTGRLLIDTGGIDLGMTTLSEGRDAEILFGNEDPALGLVLRSADNLFEDVVSGLDVTVKAASNDLTTISVARDTAGIQKAVSSWVDAFNAVVDRVNAYDFFNVDTQQKGALLGDPTLSRARQVLFSVAQGRVKGVEGAYQFLSQVGIRPGKGGKLELDQAKFDTAYAADPESVEALFATLKQEKVDSVETVIPGITVGSSKVVTTASGIGDIFNEALDRLTSSIDGAFTKSSESFQSQITRTNERLSNFDLRLNGRRERLQKQFAAMEDALAKLQTQQASLSSITSLIG
jgi:flagellar hook-associated protein 2